MLELLYATGLRVSELVGLRREHWHDGWLLVRGKGGKERLVPYGDRAHVMVGRYLASRDDATPWLFVTLAKKPMTRQNFWDRLKRYALDGRHPAIDLAAQAPPRVRDASPEPRGRSPRGPADARPRGHLDDGDLHARGEGATAGDPREGPSPRVSTIRSRMHLRNLLLVIVGGGLGSGARYLVSTWVLSRWGTGFPWGTLTVNVLGSFALGVVMQLGLGFLGAEVRILVTTGFLGGFTTYSTFNFETLRFAEHGNWALFAANAVATFVGCLVAGFAGALLGRVLGPA